MKIFIAILLIRLLPGLTVFAQMKIAQIEDKDGFTNIRNGQGTNFEIVGTIDKDDFFYCEISDTSDWYKIIALQWSRGNQLTGFVHKSRIKIVEQLKLPEQKKIIDKTLKNHKLLAERFQQVTSQYDSENKKWNSTNDSLDYNRAISELETSSDTKYDLILQVLPLYFCTSKDRQTIQLFFDTMWADKGSANELPSFSIGACFVCEPNSIIELLQQPNNEDKKGCITNHIDWGLKNIFWTEKDGDHEPSSQEYKDIYKKLEEIQKTGA